MATLSQLTQLGGVNLDRLKPKNPSYRWTGSYFEEMHQKAEHSQGSNERAKKREPLVEHLNDEIGSLFDGIHFQSNDDITRREVLAHLNGVMQDLLEWRHISDYKVECDASNNPYSVIEANDLVVDIAYKDAYGALFHAPYQKRGFAAVDVDLNIGVNGNSASNRGYSPSVGQGIGGGYVTVGGAGAIGNMVGQIAAGSTYTLTSAPPGTISISAPEQRQTAELPPMFLECKDDAGQLIRMELKPEGTISAHESLQLMLLLQASISSPLAFSPYLYVKKHSLERHFRFSTV